MKQLAVWLVLTAAAAAQTIPCPAFQRDWKRAVWRTPLHIAMSVPVAAATVVVPAVGRKYVRWRIAAEHADQTEGLDTAMKAAIDLYSQTALVNAVLKLRD